MRGVANAPLALSLVWAATLGLAAVSTAQAQDLVAQPTSDPPPRALRRVRGQNVSIAFGSTITGQTTTDGRVDPEVQASGDILFGLPLGAGRIILYGEASTTPSDHRVQRFLPAANGDAGSALESDYDGRIQPSEFRYGFPLAGGRMSAGLLDSTVFIDNSRIANDETRQFLNRGLVNNPTIDFPDYALGVAWYRNATFETPGMTLLIAQGAGYLEDDPSFSAVFDRDIPDQDGDGDEDRKGLFGALELHHRIDTGGGDGLDGARFGVWTNTRDHARLDGRPGLDTSYGAYVTFEGAFNRAEWNVRMGVADNDVSSATKFVAAAVEYPTKIGDFDSTVGVGIAHTVGNSKRRLRDDDITAAEFYVRMILQDGVELTPSLQWIRNGNFDGSERLHDEDIGLLSLRLQLDF